jgi:peroxiredoxin
MNARLAQAHPLGGAQTHSPRRQVLVAGLAMALHACSKAPNEKTTNEKTTHEQTTHEQTANEQTKAGKAPSTKASAIVVPNDLYLQNVMAGAFTLWQLGGKAVLLELWATTCAICVAEMPRIAALSERHQAKGLRTVALSMPYDRPDLVLNFAKEHRLPFPVAIDPAGHLVKAFTRQAAEHREPSLEGTPTRLLLKPSGQLIYREQGALHLDGKTLENQIIRLL